MSIDLRALHVLVVDDIAPMRQLLSELLLHMGVGKVTGAKDVYEGYSAYRRLSPDVIITDWQMPGLDGLDFIKKIRRDNDSPDRGVPIIMLTGFSSAKRAAQARDYGVTEFLTKPFTAGDIAKRLNHVVTHPRDFIFLPDFVGPDRRRQEGEDHDGNARVEETDKKIEASKKLQKKVGYGKIDTNAIERSQKVIERNRIDFIPIAREFLSELQDAVGEIKKMDSVPSRYMENLISPVMQLKANARIFKYDLVGNLSHIILNFLESINEIDQYVIEILESQCLTINLLLQKEMSGEGGETGHNFEKELQGACDRYMKIRSSLLEKKLKGL